jgi:hypothetical protein
MTAIGFFIFGVSGAFFVILGLVMFAVCIWAIVDASVRPKAAWERANQNKVLWIVLIAVLTFLSTFIGLIISLVYLLAIRPKVEAAG